MGGNYTAASLTPKNSVFRLGTGGSTLQIDSPVLTGVGNSLQIGAVNDTVAAQSVGLVNNGGTVALNAVASSNVFGAGVTINTGAVLQVGAPGALGSGAVTFNGGTIQADGSLGLLRALPPITISNSVNVIGDAAYQGRQILLNRSGSLAPTM